MVLKYFVFFKKKSQKADNLIIIGDLFNKEEIVLFEKKIFRKKKIRNEDPRKLKK